MGRMHPLSLWPAVPWHAVQHLRTIRLSVRFVQRVLITVCLMAVYQQGAAKDRQEQVSDSAQFKLAYGTYFYSDSTIGQDLNLRWESGRTRAWLGHYTDPSFGNQTRVGIDHTVKLAPSLLVQMSLETATRDFLGGSILAAMGHPWFVVAGLGRTNLKPYYNLSYDPNDSFTAGMGWKGEGETAIAMTVVADNRLDTGQRVWHLFGRKRWSDHLRTTIDLNYKQGQGDLGEPTKGWGLSAVFDFDGWFMRIARDQKQNFAPINATRVSLGVRF